MAGATGYQVGNREYLRACDGCGHQWPFKKLRYVGLGKYHCPDDRKLLTKEEIARHQARLPPMLVRPRRHPKPPAEIPSYFHDEAEVLSLLLRRYLSGATVTDMDVVVTLLSASDDSRVNCALYFYNLMTSDDRPATWRSSARTVFLSIARQLKALQYGDANGSFPSEAVDSIRYGGIFGSGGVTIIELYRTAGAGLVFLRAYALLGDSLYLTAAQRAATFLRRAQKCDALSANAIPAYNGGWPSSVSGAKVPADTFSCSGAYVMWFLKELSDLLGPTTVFGDATATGDFAAPTAATLATMLADARAFYVQLLNTAAPKDYYKPSTATFPLDATGSIQMLAFARGLLGLFKSEGYSATVAALYEWLMAFSSNPAFEQGTASDYQVANAQGATTAGPWGTYDPELALCSLMQTLSSGAQVSMNLSGTYDLAATALLAPVRIASARTMKTFKEEMSKPRRLASSKREDASRAVSVRTTGVMGMSGQAVVTLKTLASAALIGDAYRYAPVSYPAFEGPMP